MTGGFERVEQCNTEWSMGMLSEESWGGSGDEW